MRRGTRRRRLAAAAALLACGPSHAARPLLTDDARIVDAKACQVESWARHNKDSREFWAIPSCNPTGNAEIAVGGSKTREDGETHTSVFLIQAKTLFKTLEPNGWATGAVVGYQDPKTSPNRPVKHNLYAYVPTSFSFLDDVFVLHTNIGAARPDGESHHRVTWGVGSETRLHPSLFLVAEAFRQDAAGPHYQAGLRYWIVPNRVQVDATIGDRLGESRGGRWYSIGLRLLSPPFLP